MHRDGSELSLEVRCDPAAPAMVRHALTEHADLGWILGDVMLVASELVSNAVRHSGGREEDTLQVEMRVAGDRVHLEVWDPGASRSAVEPLPEELPFGGLGLRLVAQLAEQWGAERRPSGRHLVWAEIPLSRDGGA